MSVHGYNAVAPRTQKMRQSEAKAALQKIAGGGDADLTELLKDLAEWNNYTTDAIGGLINKVDARVQEDSPKAFSNHEAPSATQPANSPTQLTNQPA